MLVIQISGSVVGHLNMASNEVPERLYDKAVERHDSLVSEGKLFYEASNPEIVEHDGFIVQYRSWHIQGHIRNISNPYSSNSA